MKSKMTPMHIVTVSCVLFLVFGAACEHDVEEPTAPETVTFQTVKEQAFVDCTSCHLQGASAGGLDLSAHGNIVDVPSSQKPDYDLIEPGSPSESYCYLKMIDDPVIAGDKMPPSQDPTEEQLDLLREWIESGAPEE